MRYMLIKLSDNSIVRIMDGGIDPKVQTKAGYEWRPCPFVTPPTFIPETEVVEGPVFVVGPTEVVETYTKRNLTANELDALKDQKMDKVSFVSLQLLFDHENRLRALENKTSLTQAQFRAALKARL